ncbi:MAG: branched-chain amino acid ABC transporter permease [Actinobacteria bacterium]|nr:MAG: branched-chain amino acid ABC transporter permease [Actinomycetota bacterium]
MLAFEVARPVVLGVVQGAGVGLMAIGLVLIYKSSRVFNFAAGEFATVGAFGFYLTKSHVPFLVAALIGVLAALGTGLLTERLVIRPLANRPRVTLLVATAAVAIFVIAFQFLAGAQGKLFGAKALVSGNAFRLVGVFVSWQEIVIVVVLAASGAALAWFFGRTDLGLATLATSQEPTAARLMGIRLNRVAMLTWGLAGALGGVAGVLLPPLTQNFTPAFGTTDLLIPAFTAAVLGGMTSVPGAFVGGLVLGLVQNLTQFNVSSNRLPGAPSVAVLVVLVVVLVVRPTGILGREA